jgi:branched-chain amino acid transport system permease protein
MSENTLFLIYDFLQYLVNGLSQGSIYALIALGYTMVYGILKLINFAHGEFYMIGSFTGYFLIKTGMPIYLALPLSMLIPGLVAVIVERVAYRPIRHAGKIPALITALGVSFFFQYLGQGVIGADPKPYPKVFPDKTFLIGDAITITATQLIIMGSTVFLMFFLWWFVKFTKIGKAMRALSFSRDASELMGIDTNKVISFTFFLGAALAGFAGVLVGAYYNTVEPMMGLIPGLKAFIAAVLGGIGVIPGAFLGGLLLGVIENLVVGFWNSNYRDVVAFAILILILLIKPTGLLGKKSREKV